MVAFDLVCFQMVGLVKCCTANVTNKGSFSSMGQHMSVQTEGASEALVANVANDALAERVGVQLKRYSDISVKMISAGFLAA